MIELYAVKIPQKMEKEEYEQLLQSVSEEKQERVKRFFRMEDSFRTLLADVLIRTIVSKKFRMNNREIRFLADAYGKPSLQNVSDFSFNLSHSGSWVVGAVHQLPIGVDIERMKPINFDIARQFFSAEENHELLSKSGESKLHYFYDLWTLKESYIKAIGKGLFIPLNSFSIIKQDQDRFVLESTDECNSWFFKQYTIDPEYKLSLCAKTNQFPEEIIITDVSTLYKEMISI